MASQQSRRENVTDEREVHVEKDRVPKMATHFESLASQVQGTEVPGGPTATITTVTLGGGEVGQGQKGVHTATGKHDQEKQKAASGQSYAEKARAVNLVADKEAEAAANRSRGGGKFGVHGGEEETGMKGGRRESAQQHQHQAHEHQVRGVGKFELHGEGEKGAQGGMGERAHHVGQEHQRESQTQGKMSGGIGKFGQHQPQAQARGTPQSQPQPQAQARGTPQPQAQARGEEHLSLEEISKLRQLAQQNSAEAIRGAEERYTKEKQSGTTGGITGGSATQGAGGAMGSTFQNVAETTTQGVQKTTQFIAEKGSVAKDTALEKGQQGYVATKDTLSSAGQTAAEYAAQMAQKTKETAAQVAEKTKETVPPVAAKVKDVTLGTAQKVGSYTGQTAVAAKDVAVGTGKTAAGYAGSAAVAVKDRAVVAGWTAAEMTAGVAAGATKAAANVTKGVVGYAADTAVAAKDVVANVGQKAAEYTGGAVAQVKDTVVHAEESAKEYAARKKAEAERELEAKRNRQSKGEQGGGQVTDREAIKEEGTEGKIRGQDQAQHALQQAIHKPQEHRQERRQEQESRSGTVKEYLQPRTEHRSRGQEQMQEGTGGALKAAGETLVEIAQTPVEAAAKVHPQQQGVAQGQEGSGGGVLQAVGETLVEIAQTATGIVTGGGQVQSPGRQQQEQGK